MLVWAGRAEEGLAWLERSLAGAERPADRAVVLAATSPGQAGRGERDAAKRSLELARELDPACPLLERAARALDAAPR